MNPAVETAVGALDPIDLDELDRYAPLMTRKDRKYVVDVDGLVQVLRSMPDGVRALETSYGRWSRYESTYFDTPDLDSFRMAATRRHNRFKVRTRQYVDSGTSMVEVKTKTRGGRTVKQRRLLDIGESDPTNAVRDYAHEVAQVEAYAGDLSPRLTTTYRRATLVLPDTVARVTIDCDFRAFEAGGASTGLDDAVVVETKTNGPASAVDRILWRAAYRPVKMSKYSTSLAALHPDLSHNRWHRVLVSHFDADAGRTPGRRRSVTSATTPAGSLAR